MLLGLDWSTQQLKSVLTDQDGRVLLSAQVCYDLDLPEFRTQKGVLRGEKRVVTAPVLMWVKALDILLEKLMVSGADFSKVVAVSGSAQQHGTVYWATGGEAVLRGLDESQFLHTQLPPALALSYAPVWQDSSTTPQCRALEEAVGGAHELARITGSRAYERFSAAQIKKIAETKPTAYANTERISLVSSFGCSLLLGRYAAVDWADASGMNLLDLATKTWSPEALAGCAPELGQKLGEPVPSQTILGKISRYYVERFGFSEDCSVVAFTGDNPSSIVELCLSEADLAVSLGTSDTVMSWTDSQQPLAGGHVMLSPLPSHQYFALICFKNGSLTRERIRDSYAHGSWEEFNTLLDSNPRGNFGNIGLYYDQEELTVPLVGEFRFDRADNPVEKFSSAATEVRALLEGQFISKRALLEDNNISLSGESRVVATGGASLNKGILQVLSDVFNAPVYTLDESNSGAVGAAMRALAAVSTQPLAEPPRQLTLTATPYPDSEQIYTPMVARYRSIIKKLTKVPGD